MSYIHKAHKRERRMWGGWEGAPGTHPGTPGTPPLRPPPGPLLERPWISVLGRNTEQKGQPLDDSPNPGNLGSSFLAQLRTHARMANTNTKHDFPVRDDFVLTPKPPIYTTI